MAYILCPFVERLFLSPTAHCHSFAHQRPIPISTITVGQLVTFLSNIFRQSFFIGYDPQMYIVDGRLVLIRSPFKYIITQ